MPFSALITIRKKFIKNVEDSQVAEFLTENELITHMKSSHSECFVSEECKFAAQNKSDMRIHNEKLHEKYCHTCKYIFMPEKIIEGT